MKKNSWNGTIQTITKNEEVRYWFSFFFILIVGLVIISGYNPFEKHIRSDGAYFMYMGQAICRGELIYRDMTCGYSPMLPLINAAFMTMGRWFSVPSFVSPKLFLDEFHMFLDWSLYYIWLFMGWENLSIFEVDGTWVIRSNSHKRYYPTGKNDNHSWLWKLRKCMF